MSKKVNILLIIILVLFMLVSTVYADNFFKLEEDFQEYELGQSPGGNWQVDGDGEIIIVEDDTKNRYVQIHNEFNRSSILKKEFDSLEGKVNISFKVMLKKGGQGESSLPKYGIANLLFAEEVIKASDGNDFKNLIDIEHDHWYHINLLFDTDKGEYDVYFNGQLEAEQYNFAYSSSEIKSFVVLIENEEAILCIDDFRIMKGNINNISIQEPNEIEIVVGDKYNFENLQVIKEIEGELVSINSNNINFIVEDTNIATITGDGRLKGEGLGETIITADYMGVTDTIEVTVVAPPEIDNLVVNAELNKLNISWPEQDYEVVIIRNSNITDENKDNVDIANITGAEIYRGEDINNISDLVLQGQYTAFTYNHGVYSLGIQGSAKVEALKERDFIRFQIGDGREESNIDTVQSWRETVYTSSNVLKLGRGESGRYSDVWIYYPNLLNSISTDKQIVNAVLTLPIIDYEFDEELMNKPRGVNVYQITDEDEKGIPYYPLKDGYRQGLNFYYRDHRPGMNIAWGKDIDNILELVSKENPIARLEAVSSVFISENEETAYIKEIKFDITEVIENWLQGSNQGLFLTVTDFWRKGEVLEFASSPYLDLIIADGSQESNDLDDISNLELSYNENNLVFTWDDNLAYPTSGVRIVRKKGISPVNQFDGHRIVDIASNNNNSWEDSDNLIEGDIYYYSFFTYNDSGDYRLSKLLRVIPGSPLAPQLQELVLRDNEVELNWNSVEDAEYYCVYRQAKGEINPQPIVVGNTNNYIDNNISSNEYEYWVTAINEIGESIVSNRKTVDIVTVSEEPTQIAAGEFEALVKSGSEIKLTWPQTDYTLNYIIERRKNNEDWKEIAKLNFNELSFIDKNLAANTTYEYQIKAVNKLGTSDSTILTVTTDNEIVAVRDLRWKVISATHLKLLWVNTNANTNQSVGYKIRLYEEGNLEWTSSNLAKNTESYHITGIKPDLNYSFEVVTLGVNEEKVAKTETIRTTAEDLSDIFDF